MGNTQSYDKEEWDFLWLSMLSDFETFGDIGPNDGAASYHQERLTVSLYFVNTVNQKLICMYKAA